MWGWLRIFQFGLILLFVSGCASTGGSQSRENEANRLLQRIDEGAEITLMPFDVELSLLTAGGLMEPKAEWTENARINMRNQLQNTLHQAGYRLVDFDAPPDSPEQELYQVQKLHEAVGFTIINHHYGATKLPSKQGRLDWSVGEGAELLKSSNESQYALFVFLRDSFSSTGRVAFQILAAVVGGAVSGGQKAGFASLVDLETGEVVWFDFLLGGAGDPRSLDGAGKTVQNMFSDFPRVD